jgi:hypothetical protein
MSTYTLYVKTHKKTGLKYFGQTSKPNPHTYHGSGKDWVDHIAQYGYDVVTDIIFQGADIAERNQWGRYYSRLWNIVNAQDDFGNKIWANRIPETGGGPGAPKGAVRGTCWNKGLTKDDPRVAQYSNARIGVKRKNPHPSKGKPNPTTTATHKGKKKTYSVATTGTAPAKNSITGEKLGLISTADPRWSSGEICGVNKGQVRRPLTIEEKAAKSKAQKGIKIGPMSAEHKAAWYASRHGCKEEAGIAPAS